MLPKPIFALAPMEGVTDTVFRQVIVKCGKPDVFFTEFTNVDGLFSKGHAQVEHRLLFTKKETPLIAQLWGMRPENYFKAATLVRKSGFSGIDINMGCPEKNVVKRGACAGLIHNPKLAAEIITAVKKGAGNLPVSVKTRMGIREIEIDSWIPFLLNQNIDALTVHARTVAEMSNAPAHWDKFEKVVNLKNQISPKTVILGNGDIESLEDARKLISKFNLDGVMIGRGIFKDPFLFNKTKTLTSISFDARMKLLLFHSKLFEEQWNSGKLSNGKPVLSKHFAILRKFYKVYTHGLPNASDIRKKLMETNTLEDVKKVIMNL